MKMKRRRSIIVSVINWLSDFGVNTQEPINRILDRYPKSERSKRYSELMQSLKSYKTDPESLYLIFAKHLPSLTTHGDLLHRERKIDMQSDTCSTDSSVLPYFSSFTSLCPSECNEDAKDDQLLKIENDEDGDGDNVNDDISKYITNEYIYVNSYKVTSYWPEALLNAFRKYLITPIFLDSILSCGSVFVCGIESLEDCNSIYSDSMYLRSIIYNLILGVESNITFRFPNYLIGVEKSGLSYYVTELDRKGSFYIKRRKVLVQPIELSPVKELVCKTDRRLAFLQEYLGLIHNPFESTNSWLTVVALLNVLTYRSKCSSFTDDITLCPLSLTFGAICICTHLLISRFNYSDLSYCKPFKKHFNHCAKYFITQLNTNIKTKRHLNKEKRNDQHTLNIHIVHAYGQLQIHYMVISTLTNLLNSLITDDEREKLPTCLNLPPICSIFPSGFLFHEVYYCINQIKSPSDRHQYVSDIIIEKLMNYQDNSKYLNDALRLFDEYLRVLSEVQLTVSFIKCSAKAKTTVAASSYEKSQKTHYNTSINDTLKQVSNSVSVTKTSRHTNKNKATNKTKQFKKNVQQPSNAEIEERITKLMLENGLLD
ncbi:unnamed protein product [Heterobilharzia americana]|nr:unnamed protein product [Heterobilharzia americana]